MTRSDKTKMLGRSLLFSGLGKQELEELAGLSVERHYGIGDMIFREGDLPERFTIVEQGRVKVVKHSPSGSELIVAIFDQGEMFGEVAVLDGGAYPASAQAMSETTILSVNKDELLEFLSKNPAVSMKIINVLGRRLRDAHARMRYLARERAEQRVAGILVLLSSKLDSALPFTRQEIADMAGTTTETTIRVMSRMRDGGIIRSSRGRITVLDAVKLRLLSEGPPTI